MAEPTGERLARIETSVEGMAGDGATLTHQMTKVLQRVARLEASRNGHRRRQFGWMGGGALGGGGMFYLLQLIAEALK